MSESPDGIPASIAQLGERQSEDLETQCAIDSMSRQNTLLNVDPGNGSVGNTRNRGGLVERSPRRRLSLETHTHTNYLFWQ